MKIVVFAPHPDDEIFGCGGSILKWLEEGHNIHVIYVTDNRVLITWGLEHDVLLLEEAKEFINLSEDEIAKIALKEAEQVSQDFGLKKENVHLFKFYDQGATEKIEDGVTMAKEIIRDADRIVIPSDNNNHVDHQATHTMAKRAAKELNLKNLEFYVYAAYNILKVPKEKQIKIKMEQYRDKLYELMKGYKTQLCFKDTRMGWEYVLKRKRTERFGVFRFEDMNKYQNF